MAQAVSSADVISNTSNAPWKVAVKPFKVTDQIWYIGNLWVGAYLIDTGDGLILLDTMCAETAYLMVDNIYRLGYRPEDIKMILLSHAHVDHYGAAAFMHNLSGAPIYLSKTDEDFRRSEAAHAQAAAPAGAAPMRDYDFDTDCFYNDTKPIVLGNVTIRTKLTPGHTPGVTSFFITAEQKDGRIITAAMHGGVGVLTMSDAYFAESGLSPALRTRFIDDCKAMESEKVDVCLPSHPAHFPGNFFEMGKMSWDNGNPFVDETAWVNFLRSRSQFAIDLENKAKSAK